MIELFLVRHGETIENSKGIIQGQTEGTLTQNGIEQNKKLAIKLKNLNFEVAFSSPLKRAVQTAEQIVKFHEVDLIKDPRLVERNMGVLQGKKIPTFYDVKKDYEGMESLQDIFNRVQSFLEYLLKSHNNKTILVVSHGITLIILTAIINRIQISNLHEIKVLANSSYSNFTLEKMV